MMNQKDKYPMPLPLVLPETAGFWEAARRHELVIQSCRACGAKIHFPRLLCPQCLSQDLGWERASGQGTVYSFTIVHKALDECFGPLLPYVYAVIELAEGVRMISNVVGIAPEEARVSLPVQVVFEDVTPEISLPRFQPIKKDY
jgi:hypothetical protein